jgi:hypothetical protein
METKKLYSAPKVEQIKLDADISLQLVSGPPEGPGEGSLAPNYFNNDPYKTIQG